MNTFLLVWNPRQWEWNNIDECIEIINKKGEYSGDNWSCGRVTQINTGDRIFIIRLGKEPRGIFASGYADSQPYPKKHWNKELAKQGIKTNFIDITFDVIINPDNDKNKILHREMLKEQFPGMFWDTRSPGVLIPQSVARQLEKQWMKRNNTKTSIGNNKNNLNNIFPDEITQQSTFIEGAIQQIQVNRFERDSEARKKCISYFGLNCIICGFNFEKVYGEIGKNLIHVHHLKPLSKIGKKYKVDPIKDLRPVCPNCHTIIHKRDPLFSIDEVKEFIKKSNKRRA